MQIIYIYLAEIQNSYDSFSALTKQSDFKKYVTNKELYL